MHQLQPILVQAVGKGTCHGAAATDKHGLRQLGARRRTGGTHWRQTCCTAKLVCMKLHKLVLLAIACTWAMGAAAQWQWIDKDGRKVFSDRPPPQDIPEKNMLKQPGFSGPRVTTPAASAPAAAAAPAPAGAASGTAAAPTAPASAASGKDKELEKRKAEAEAAEAAKKKAEDDKVAKAKAENCTLARQAKAGLESGAPMKQTNAQGERVFMDEPQRVAETKRINAVIASDCKR